MTTKSPRTTRTAKTATRTAKESAVKKTTPTKKSAPKRSDQPTTSTAAAPTIESIKTLTGDALHAAYREVLGDSPNPKAPAVALRKRIVAALERRGAAKPEPAAPVAHQAARAVVPSPDPDAEIDAAHEAAMAAAREAVDQGADPKVCSDAVAAYHAGEIDHAAFEARLAAAVATANEAPVDAPAAEPATGSEAGPQGASSAEVNPSTAASEAPSATGKRSRKAAAANAPTTTGRTLPPVGTVLQKKDRHGVVRCQSTVVEGGILFGGVVYKSLSAAAIAASRDLGNATKQTNGWTFWGLTSTPRTATAKKGLNLDVIERAWTRYRDRADAAAKAASDDERAKLREMLLAHSTAIFGLATPPTTTTTEPPARG